MDNDESKYSRKNVCLKSVYDTKFEFVAKIRIFKIEHKLPGI